MTILLGSISIDDEGKSSHAHFPELSGYGYTRTSKISGARVIISSPNCLFPYFVQVMRIGRKWGFL